MQRFKDIGGRDFGDLPFGYKFTRCRERHLFKTGVLPDHRGSIEAVDLYLGPFGGSFVQFDNPFEQDKDIIACIPFVKDNTLLGETFDDRLITQACQVLFAEFGKELNVTESMHACPC